jgi:hypothetical protein
MLTQRRIGGRAPNTAQQGNSCQAHLRRHPRRRNRCHGSIQVPEIVVSQIQQMDTVCAQQVEGAAPYALFCLWV